MVKTDHSLCTGDLPGSYARQAGPEQQPVNSVAQAFAQELQPDAVQRGESAMLALQLTFVKDGTVLGVSASHALAGMPF